MKSDNAEIDIVANRALKQAHGNIWLGYEYAKQEVNAMLENEPQKARDNAIRYLAATMNI